MAQRKYKKHHYPKKNAISKRKTKKSNKTNKDFFFFFLLGVVVCSAYFIYHKKSNHSKNPNPLKESPGTGFIDPKRITAKERELKLKQEVESQKAASEKFKPSVKNIESTEPEISSLDMGIHFSDNTPMESLVKNLEEKPLDNDVYKDPEQIILQQIDHQQWLEDHLQKRNEKEKREFIMKFIKIAKEQGYNVLFEGDDSSKIILEPIKEEEAEEEETEVNINWN